MSKEEFLFRVATVCLTVALVTALVVVVALLVRG